ncbi:hypothetical protein E4198_21895 [Streptomyces sp. RKND-216]|uniref:hypothetical protein n=1 Tax=Streptomyces sp. RKND-216 TaxID=2562581 RepID=UPI00109D82CD|nr:hypothetical protein [Streptomyces sp. RKND-216]THA26960.1 hypothetical protein E4198_21895 [Streptomyces sp. RKND-216]
MSVSRLRSGLGAVALACALVAAPGVGLATAAETAAPTTATAAPAPAAPTLAATKLSHSDAASRFSSSGITWSSTGGCSDRNTPTCTSFSQINLATVQGAQTLKSASGCALHITGGTETGHAGGTYSHWNGYKLDFRPTSCVNGYITGTFTYIGDRGDGAALYEAASGNIYARESNHWDVTFYNCGGC